MPQLESIAAAIAFVSIATSASAQAKAVPLGPGGTIYTPPTWLLSPVQGRPVPRLVQPGQIPAGPPRAIVYVPTEDPIPLVNQAATTWVTGPALIPFVTSDTQSAIPRIQQPPPPPTGTALVSMGADVGVRAGATFKDLVRWQVREARRP